MKRKVAYVAGVLGAAVLFLSPVRASIAGFGDFANFTINIGDTGASPAVTILPGDASSINIINGGGEHRSIFDNTPQPISSFTASFTFQASGGNPDGTAFIIQGSSSGPNALGFGDGYGGITSSVAIPLELDNGGGTDTGLYTNGNTGGTTSSNPVAIFSNHPINVSLSYNGSLLSEMLTDSTTSATYSASYLVNIPSLVGGTTATVGFGSSSNFGSTQTISNFQFSAAPEPATWSVIAASGILVLCRRRA